MYVLLISAVDLYFVLTSFRVLTSPAFFGLAGAVE
jgi:hypothetical protein